MNDPGIVEGLAANSDPVQRRAKRAAAAWKPDPELTAMREMHKTDPKRFSETYGSRGDLLVGLYDSAATAAGVDLDPPDAA